MAYVHHWGRGDVTVPVPTAVTDALNPSVRLAAGDLLPLGPWDVVVLVLGFVPTSERRTPNQEPQ